MSLYRLANRTKFDNLDKVDQIDLVPNAASQFYMRLPLNEGCDQLTRGECLAIAGGTCASVQQRMAFADMEHSRFGKLMCRACSSFVEVADLLSPSSSDKHIAIEQLHRETHSWALLMASSSDREWCAQSHHPHTDRNSFATSLEQTFYRSARVLLNGVDAETLCHDEHSSVHSGVKDLEEIISDYDSYRETPGSAIRRLTARSTLIKRVELLEHNVWSNISCNSARHWWTAGCLPATQDPKAWSDALCWTTWFVCILRAMEMTGNHNVLSTSGQSEVASLYRVQRSLLS